MKDMILSVRVADIIIFIPVEIWAEHGEQWNKLSPGKMLKTT